MKKICLVPVFMVCAALLLQNVVPAENSDEAEGSHDTDYYTESDPYDTSSFTDAHTGITVTLGDFTDNYGNENCFDTSGSGSAGALTYVDGHTYIFFDNISLYQSPGVDEADQEFFDTHQGYDASTYGYISRDLSEDEQVSNYLLLHDTHPSEVHSDSWVTGSDGSLVSANAAPPMNADNGMRGETQTETINGRQASWFLETWGMDAGDAGENTTELWVYFFTIDLNETDSAYIIVEGFYGNIYEEVAKSVAGAYTFS